ncbi:hypothetical protein [Sediminibacterium soli]|uniref:hypothetical protein n=1 Tax=Sediminibacterium soli TaxID=2698829 RepID=UPI00137ABB23|nr:hypothetical protein [Sediminibacterium soli]NCI46384.1 hypothetical protein [Sediminibacterium soli]
MELDDLKYHLQNKLANDHAGRSDNDIASLLNRKTISLTEKLQKNLWFEIVCSILVVIGFFAISFVTSYASVRIYFRVFGLLSLGFIGLLFFLLKRTKTLSATALPVKSNLQTIVKIMEEFIKRYFQFTMALIPICIVFAFILMYTDNQRIAAADHLAKNRFNHSWKVIAFVLVYFTALATGVYYFTKWYLRKLYGRYVQQLKECIGELEEEEK